MAASIGIGNIKQIAVLSQACLKILRSEMCIDFKQKRLLNVATALLSRKIPDVCQSPDKKMVMCWHPEPDFPYEHTQPLVRDKSEMTEGDSVLKVQYLLDDKLKNHTDGPTEEELCRIFYTSKRVWRLRPRHEKRQGMRAYIPVDRDGL